MSSVTRCIVAVLATNLASSLQFTAVLNGLLCIRPEFTETHLEAATDKACGLLCHFNDRCQAFSTATGSCQLFVFDACSEYVTGCGNCSQRGPVFVRQQAGLQPGALCPSGFADDFCGTKYKLYPGTNWYTLNSTVSAQPGLVTMLDLTDAAELAQVKSLLAKYSWSLVFTGGYQLPGSASITTGWIWVSCKTNMLMNSSIWVPGEPTNYANEIVAILDASKAKLNNYVPSNPSYTGILAECVSPFN